MWQAQASGIPASRVDEVLSLVGLTDVAGKKVGGFSLGMGQRLGIAAALLGDPEYLILDEPVNGLDPEGIRWVRSLLRALAQEGRTILVSSHLLAEMAQTADHLIVIGKGKLVADTSVHDFIKAHSGSRVVVRAADDGLSRLQVAVEAGAPGATISPGTDADGRPNLTINDATPETIGRIAFEAGVILTELSEHHASLEDAYIQSTEGTEQFASRTVQEGK